MLTIEGLKSLKPGVGKIKMLPTHISYSDYKNLIATIDSMDSSYVYWKWSGRDNSLCHLDLSSSSSMSKFVIVCNICEQPDCLSMNPITHRKKTK